MLETEEIFYDIMDKKVLKKCRHKAEVRWYRRLVILNLMIIIGITAWFISEKKENIQYVQELKADAAAYMNDDGAELSSDEKKQLEENLDKKIEDIPTSVKSCATVLGLLIILPLIVSYAYAGYRSMSVKITEKNFPDIYLTVKEYAERLGMKKVPNVYLVQGNGILNAFSACIPFRQYIELYADLVEVAYREHYDMKTLRFIIAHEITHIYLGHAKLSYLYSILFANMIPILSSTASRAREYSCDRIAQKLSGSDGFDAMMTLTAGIHLYPQVSKHDYIENAKSVKGFFVWCFNLVSSHPVMSKRILALEMKEGNGKLY